MIVPVITELVRMGIVMDLHGLATQQDYPMPVPQLRRLARPAEAVLPEAVQQLAQLQQEQTAEELVNRVMEVVHA